MSQLRKGHNMKIFPELLWAGTDHSLELAQQALARIDARMVAGPWDQTDPADNEDCPYNLDVQDNVGVITVRGPLLNIDSPYARYCGVSTYADIRRALISAAGNADVEAILLDIDSGGGAVSGVSDTANLISVIDAKVKKVCAFTDGTMASAAYWLGVSASEVHSSSTSLVGSVGVLRTAIEYSKQMAMEGVTAKILRSGKYKALVNSIEPLTKTAEEEAQAQLDTVYGVFLSHVATHRKVTAQVADDQMGQGREFVGQQALAAGLVDSVTTFDALVSKIGATIAQSPGLSQSPYGNNNGGTMKKALTEQDIAALAAGAGATETVVETVVETQAETVVETKAETVVEQPKESDVVSFLKGELRTTTADVTQARVDLAAAQAQVASLTASQASLVAIAAKSLSNMKVALGGTAVDASALSVDALLADHAATVATFAKTFKAGGVAAVSTGDKAADKAVDPNYAKRIAATRSTK
jgi:signal peptide peptidase SppA